ncbi:SIS domain-containing protein, partial [Pelagibacterales bacterium SAG-MED49]|nr:SIS domain-containing protein [Pelagibacterales bacterium SAG-MED49]
MNIKIDKFLGDYLDKLNKFLLSSNIENIYKASQAIMDVSKRRKTIFVCGNGGSAAISNHYVCDYLKFLRQKSSLRPKVVSLSSNLETIMAIGNDINFDQIFRYQAESLAEKGDLLIVISSSGNSKNIKEVIKYAKGKKIKIIGFSGFNGGYV